MTMRRVPAAPRWGVQTELARQNFDGIGPLMPLSIVHHVARIKLAAARVNGHDPEPVIGVEVTAAIEAAAVAVASGRYDEHFPLVALQTGSGTSTNMNVNEVIAGLAGESLGVAVHPNDVVNARQSSNDVMPTALHLALLDAGRSTMTSAERLVSALEDRGRVFADVVTVGRTHLMDAAPVLMGWQFDGWAAQVADTIGLVQQASMGLLVVPLGGTAVGTGLNTRPGWRREVLAELAAITGHDLVLPRHAFAAQSGLDAVVAASAAARSLAVAVHKVANDLRLLGSGPLTGFAELRLPEVQAGSSIMPGKVNPVMCEAAIQAALKVMGNDVTVGMAAASGQLAITATFGVVAISVLESYEMLSAACERLASRCIDAIEVDAEQCRRHAAMSPAIVTALSPVIGYDASAALAHQLADHPGRSLLEALLDSGHDRTRAEELVALADPSVLARETPADR